MANMKAEPCIREESREEELFPAIVFVVALISIWLYVDRFSANNSNEIATCTTGAPRYLSLQYN